MNVVLANPECSSGCESGWTLYLENSYVSPYPTYKSNDFVEHKRLKDDNGDEEEEEEEDLSMVSDASSGPPHFHEDEYHGHHHDNNNGCTFQAPIDAALMPKKTSKREKKGRENQCRKIHEQPSLLDDTASSPIFNFSNNNFAVINNQASMPNMLDFSQGYSTTHFEGRSAYQEHYGFFQSSLSGNQLQQNQWYEGKRW